MGSTLYLISEVNKNIYSDLELRRRVMIVSLKASALPLLCTHTGLLLLKVRADRVLNEIREIDD